jgi:uncharacterized FlaG/YvyC family protein
MEIHPIDSVGASAQLSNNTPSARNDVPVRQMVAAVREINKAELMGQNRQLNFTRDPETKLPVIQIVDQSTGDVIDQLPAEALLQLAEQLK